MLLLSLLARVMGPSAPSLVADDLAVLVSVALVGVAAAYLRFGPK